MDIETKKKKMGHRHVLDSKWDKSGKEEKEKVFVVGVSPLAFFSHRKAFAFTRSAQTNLLANLETMKDSCFVLNF